MKRLLCVSFLLPAGAAVFLVVQVSPVVQFSVAALGLLPLAWLIGEATDQAGMHTGPMVGGLLNATFGNAVELFVSYFAISNAEFEVVRGSLTGSVVSNALLVVGLTFLVAGRGRLARRSTYVSVAQLALAVPLLLAVSVPYWSGLERSGRAYAGTTVPVLVTLFVLYVASTVWLLRSEQSETDEEARWSLKRSLLILGVGVAAAGFVSEVMTSAISGFADALGVSVFFVSVVFVALAGNAAEHGSSILVAYRGKLELGVEVALKSASQVAAGLIPLVALLSWLVDPLPLDFRVIEIAVLAGAALLLLAVVAPVRADRPRGIALAVGYAAAVALFFAFS
jgi:Ca2+:H+ antiporter